MKKQKFYSVSQVCELLKIPPHTLRYWENQFELKFQRNSAQRRIISSEQLKKLELIQHLLHREKMTIKGARRKLKEMGLKPEELPQTKDKREILLWLKKELIGLRATLQASKPAD